VTRILVVDDSAAEAEETAGIFRSLGCEVEATCDGIDALVRLGNAKFDLVIVDHDMPNLTGAEMLEAMRVQDDRTAAIILLSEMKRATLTALSKLGVADFAVKPVARAELVEKVERALGHPLAAGSAAAGLAGGSASPDGAANPAQAGRSFALPEEPAQILVVDDMPEIRERILHSLPADLAAHGCASAQEAQLAFSRHQYRLVFFDAELSVAGLPAFIGQAREQQPGAVFVGIVSSRESAKENRFADLTFDDVLQRNAEPALIGEMGEQYGADYRGVVRVERETCLHVAPFHGNRKRLARYLAAVATQLTESIKRLAEECADRAILDGTSLPEAQAPRTAQALCEVVKLGEVMGLPVKLVAVGAIVAELRGLPDGAKIRCYGSLAEAEAG
jgi:CheY-like chemotaxis protein